MSRLVLHFLKSRLPFLIPEGYLFICTTHHSIFRYSTPLHDAVCCGRQEVVRLLLEAGARVDALDYKEATPLRLAIRYSQWRDGFPLNPDLTTQFSHHALDDYSS